MHFVQVKPALIFAVLGALFPAALPSLSAADSRVGQRLEEFSLPAFGTDNSINLKSFEGKIVVLDFFAYWCQPCLKATRELRERVLGPMSKAGGNRDGIPVEAFYINIEDRERAETAAFIAKAGLEQVFVDAEQTYFNYFGATGVPFCVLINGTRDSLTHGYMEVFYVHAGDEGAEKLRELINTVRRRPAPESARAPALAKSQARLSGAEFSLAALNGAPGIFAENLTLRCKLDHPRHRTTLSAESGQWKLAYRPSPSSLLGTPASRAEIRHQIGMADEWNLKSDVLFSSLYYYDGFGDYKSIWIAEYDRQLFQNVPGYEPPAPRGGGAALGVRHEVVPATAFLRLDLSYQHDTLAPSYIATPFQPLRKGRENLDSLGASITWEQSLSARTRYLGAFQTQQSTGRDARLSLLSRLHQALGNHVVLKTQLQAGHEEPAFDSWSLAGVLEYDWRREWFAGIMLRTYRDTGLTDRNQINVEVYPDLTTREYGLHLRRQDAFLASSVAWSRYTTRYGALSPTTRPFSELLQNRNWNVLQLILSYGV